MTAPPCWQKKPESQGFPVLNFFDLAFRPSSLLSGASAEEEDELYERGVVESNCVYRLVENRLVPHEEAWASIPSVSILGSSEAVVLDFGSEVYLWHGQDVTPCRRDIALQLTRQLWAGAYDYSNCRVNPLDPTQSNTSVPL